MISYVGGVRILVVEDELGISSSLDRGFTAVELLVVVAIFIVIEAISGLKVEVAGDVVARTPTPEG